MAIKAQDQHTVLLEALLKSLRTVPGVVFSERTLGEFFKLSSESLRPSTANVSERTTARVGVDVRRLVEALIQGRELLSLDLRSADYPDVHRYSAGQPIPFLLAQSVVPSAHLSHASAVALHGLTDELPKTFYINREQSKKPKAAGGLTQGSLDAAFRRPQRASRYILEWRDLRFVLLSGKNSGRYGVQAMGVQGIGDVRVTDLERTLVDVAVRPDYGGGVPEVMAVFERAAPKLSVNKLVAALKHLDYIYPYHQALGFYLSRAGVEEKRLQRLRTLGVTLDFYVTYGMKDPDYDESWRVFHPKGL